MNAPTEIKRETRQWWAVVDGNDVRKVTGYDCKPHNPETWWCPEVGFSLSEKHHLFRNEVAALEKAMFETAVEMEKLKARHADLERRLIKSRGFA